MKEFALYGLFAALLCAVTLIGLARISARSRPGPGPHRGRAMEGLVLAGFWAIGTAYVTLRTGSGLGARLNLVPLMFDGRGSVMDAIFNVLAFVPLGVALAVAGMRFPGALAVGLASTLAIETTQYVLDDGRTADINDVITNTTGALVGWALAATLRAVVEATRSRGSTRRIA